MPLAPLSRRLASSLAAGTLAAMLAFSAGHAADEQERRDAKAVIERQLEAFAHDDFGAAYGLASPAIQEIFPSESAFMEMVRRGFQPVYRAKSHAFSETRDTEAGLDQLVRVIDEQGIEWDALYSMERSVDGTWRISGCRLIKSPDRSA